MSCETCKDRQKETDSFNNDLAMAHMAKIIRLLIVAVLICVFLLAASNAAWLYAWNSYDYSGTEEIVVDGKEGTANYIGGDNSGRLIINGASDSAEDQNQVEAWD
jgi:cell division septal protein FtsQ